MKVPNNECIRVMITGVGHPISRSTLESLRVIDQTKFYFVGIDIRRRGNNFDWIDRHYQVPMTKSSDFIPRLKDICQKQNIDIIIPWSDDEVEVISREASSFKKMGTTILSSSYDTVRLVIDKGIMLQELRKANICVPEFHLASQPEEIEETAKSLGYPEKIVVVKPRRSTCGIGLWILDADTNLIQSHPAQRLTLSALLSLISDVKAFGKTIPDYIVMQYLEGDDYSVNRDEPEYLSCTVMYGKFGDILVIVNGLREKFEPVILMKLAKMGVTEQRDKDKDLVVGYRLGEDFIRIAYVPDERY